MYNEGKVLYVVWLWHPRTQVRSAAQPTAAGDRASQAPLRLLVLLAAEPF